MSGKEGPLETITGIYPALEALAAQVPEASAAELHQIVRIVGQLGIAAESVMEVAQNEARAARVAEGMQAVTFAVATDRPARRPWFTEEEWWGRLNEHFDVSELDGDQKEELLRAVRHDVGRWTGGVWMRRVDDENPDVIEWRLKLPQDEKVPEERPSETS